MRQGIHVGIHGHKCCALQRGKPEARIGQSTSPPRANCSILLGPASFKPSASIAPYQSAIAHGAALLALGVGIMTNNSLLMAQAQEVLYTINLNLELEDKREAQYMADTYSDGDASREKHKQAVAMVKELVCKEFHDPRWNALVELYKKAFPTFLVRDSVYARIGPRQAATRLRTELVALVKSKRLSRAPTRGEVHASLPEAKALLESRTVPI